MWWPGSVNCWPPGLNPLQDALLARFEVARYCFLRGKSRESTAPASKGGVREMHEMKVGVLSQKGLYHEGGRVGRWVGRGWRRQLSKRFAEKWSPTRAKKLNARNDPSKSATS